MRDKLYLNSPVQDQDFIWVAAMSNGTFFPEYSFEDGSPNNFQDIDRSSLIRFGLVGMGLNMYYEIYGGHFKICGRMIEVIYKDKTTNIDYYLTGQPMIPYNDIIQFKSAFSDINSLETGGSLKTNISQYNFGFKQNLKINDTNFNFKAICCVPYGGNIYLNIRVVSDRDFEKGVLIIRRNLLETFEFDAPMQANHAYEMNWVVS
jgi:hypothetical protein